MATAGHLTDLRLAWDADAMYHLLVAARAPELLQDVPLGPLPSESPEARRARVERYVEGAERVRQAFEQLTAAWATRLSAKKKELAAAIESESDKDDLHHISSLLD